ncbi:unnamed protein product, partial [Nesidiocoris tenuis]
MEYDVVVYATESLPAQGSERSSVVIYKNGHISLSSQPFFQISRTEMLFSVRPTALFNENFNRWQYFGYISTFSVFYFFLATTSALWNARMLWPRCARFLFNTYRGFPLTTFTQDDAVIESQEGTTQGDPLGMLMYA